MATFSQLPGVLDIYACQGDDLTIALSFPNQNLTGYTFASVVYVKQQTVPTSGGVSVPTAGQTAATVTVTPVSLSSGTLTVGLNKTQTAALSPAGTYRWYLRWTDAAGIVRTVLSGNVVISVP